MTFCLPHIPETVQIGYLKVKVSLYVPTPMRCYTCQKFGHTSSKCTATDETCVRCGKHRHEGACDLKCTNCEGECAANSKECPRWKLESAIQRVRAEQKVSFGEAKKIVQASGSSGSVNTNSKSFAKVVSSGQSSSLQDAIQKLTTTVEQLKQRVAHLESRLALCNSVTGPSGDRSSATKLVSPFSFSAAGPLNKEDPVFIPPFKLTSPSCSQSKTDSKNVSTSKDGGRPPIPAKPGNLQKTASSQGRSSSWDRSSRNSSSMRSPEKKSTKSQHSSNSEKKSPLKGENSSKPVSDRGQTLSPSKGKKNDKPVPSKKAAANPLSTSNRFDLLTDEGDRMDAD